MMLINVLLIFSDRTLTTSHVQLLQSTTSSQPQSHQLVMGTKRGRFLMRQPRIKRESDPSQNPDGDPLSLQYLSVPPLRVERQCSDPLPTISPPPGNLLTVPGGNTLVKQHSHPLLPSEMHQVYFKMLQRLLKNSPLFYNFF